MLEFACTRKRKRKSNQNSFHCIDIYTNAGCVCVFVSWLFCASFSSKQNRKTTDLICFLFPLSIKCNFSWSWEKSWIERSLVMNFSKNRLNQLRWTFNRIATVDLSPSFTDYFHLAHHHHPTLLLCDSFLFLSVNLYSICLASDYKECRMKFDGLITNRTTSWMNEFIFLGQLSL